MKDLIKFGSSAGDSKLTLPWKIDCNSFSNNDIESLAAIISSEFSFQEVLGVPTGGLRLAKALKKYKSKDSRTRLLIVDDVLTTDKSMEEFRVIQMKSMNTTNVWEVEGVVIFASYPCANWITPIFKLHSQWR